MSLLWQEVPRSLAFAVIAILGLNVLDMVLTLQHIELGAIEVNPLMRQLIERGPFAFAAGKHFLVGFGVLALTTQCHHSAARSALRYVLLPGFLLLALYQLVLLGIAP